MINILRNPLRLQDLDYAVISKPDIASLVISAVSNIIVKDIGNDNPSAATAPAVIGMIILTREERK